MWRGRSGARPPCAPLLPMARKRTRGMEMPIMQFRLSLAARAGQVRADRGAR